MKKTALFLMVLCGWQIAAAKTTLSTITGAWYDDSYNGSGFNMVEAPNGLFVYFYGYKGSGSNGKAQWLLSKTLVPTPLEKGKTYNIDMVSGFIGNGGSFTTKPTMPNSGTRHWGTMQLTFNSCSAGVATLNGEDGQITHNIVRIAKVSGLNCVESGVTPLTVLKTFGIFTVMSDRQTVTMDGTISTRSLDSFRRLIQEFPLIKKINIKNCPGSMDDTANLQLSMLVHNKGINIHVLDDGEIASGGVDFFLAGRLRSLGARTKVGVHSWSSGDGATATDFPVGHAFHQPYINYYKNIGFTEEQAKAFYYFTINAAPADGMWYMTPSQIEQYNIVKLN